MCIIFLCTVSSSLINANPKLKWLHSLIVSTIELLSLISSHWKWPLTFLASHGSVHSPLLHILPPGVIIYPHDLLPHHNVTRKAGPVACASWNFCSAQPASGLTVHLWDWRAQRSQAPGGIIPLGPRTEKKNRGCQWFMTSRQPRSVAQTA